MMGTGRAAEVPPEDDEADDEEPAAFDGVLLIEARLAARMTAACCFDGETLGPRLTPLLRTLRPATAVLLLLLLLVDEFAESDRRW